MSTRAKDPKIVAESQKVYQFTKKAGTIIVIILIVLIFFMIKMTKIEKSEEVGQLTPATQNWQLCWEKNPDATMDELDIERCMPAVIQKEEEFLLVFYKDKTGKLVGKTSSSSSNLYDGTWKDNGGWGNFHLRFVSPNSAVGWVDDKGEKPISLWLVKT